VNPANSREKVAISGENVMSTSKSPSKFAQKVLIKTCLAGLYYLWDHLYYRWVLLFFARNHPQLLAIWLVIFIILKGRPSICPSEKLPQLGALPDQAPGFHHLKYLKHIC
jgi:hypothetical protein